MAPALADIIAGGILAMLSYVALQIRGIRGSVERTERAVFGTDYGEGLVHKVDTHGKRIDDLERDALTDGGPDE